MKYYPTILLLSLFLTTVDAQDSADTLIGSKGTAVRADDVPAGQAGLSYIPGVAIGNDSINPSSYSKHLKIDASFRAGASMSCGSLDFSDPLKEAKRQFKSIARKAKRIPQMISGAVSSAIAALPNYVLAKINPQLYQLMQKGLDEYLNIIEIKTKSCQQIENEIRSNPDGNPFGNIIKIAINDQWMRNVDKFNNSSEPIESLDEELAEDAAKNGITLADGKQYGGLDQDPVNMIESMAVAGINLLVGREDKATWKSDFTSSSAEKAKHPILKEFDKPKDLYQFIEDIYGTTLLRTYVDEGSPTASAIPGKGYEKKYVEYRDELYPKIRARVFKEMSRTDFENETGIIIPPMEWDQVRSLNTYATQVEIERMAKQYAIDKLKKQLVFIKQVLKTGVYSPDLQATAAREMAEKEYKNLYYRIVDDIAEIQNRMYQ